MTISACDRHRCHACCEDTRMSLTLDDVRRLEATGESGFFREEADGTLRLVNVGGRCIFLSDGRCRVYPVRPDGCVLYPLVWCEETSAAGLHDFCPWAEEFRFSAGDAAWLARSIAAEEREVAARLAAGGGDSPP